MMSSEVWVSVSALLGIALGSLVGVPVAPLYIALGLSMGMVGLPAVACALVISFVLSYALAQGPLRSLLQRLLKKQRLPDVDALGRWRVIGIVRIMPGVPLWAQNYLLGILRVGFWPNLLVSLPVQLLWAVGFMRLGESFMHSHWISFAMAGVALILLSALLKEYGRRKNLHR